MLSKYSALKEKYQKAKIEKEIEKKAYRKLRFESKQLKEKKEAIEKAKIITQIVAKKTQENIRYHISNLVNFALQSVFENPPEFKIEVVIKRGKTEVELKFEENGFDCDPIDDTGSGGILDITSIALRIAVWSLNKNDRCFILDEPTKHLRGKVRNSRASKLLKILSEKRNIQFIIVADNDGMNDYSDKSFLVEKTGNISSIKEI